MCAYNTFLQHDDWGNCITKWNDLNSKINLNYYIHDLLPYSMKTCEYVRLSLKIFKNKQCVPYNTRKLFQKKINYCNDLYDIPNINDDMTLDDDIYCLPECKKVEYIFTRMSNRLTDLHYLNQNNISMMKITFNKNIWSKRSQSRLLHLVDILSKMGGNTSLFCGFSCVTLMETFIFIFKSIVHLIYYGVNKNDNEIQQDIEKQTLICNVEKDDVVDIVKHHIKESISDKGESHSLPSTPINTPVIDFSRKISLPSTPSDKHLTGFSIIDTISERDETETTKSSYPSVDIPKRNIKDHPKSILKRTQTTTRYRDSINSMDARHRVDEPFVGFQASVERNSFSSPLRARLSKGSIKSTGQLSLHSLNLRKRQMLSSKNKNSLIRYNSGIGDF